jgi:L-fucono-1,5-lactonase
MRIDSHHHVWDLSVRPQDWIVGQEMRPLMRNFALGDLRPAADAAGIDRSVLVQTVADLGETPELLQLAATDPSVAGVVGWVDLESPTAEEDLEAHLRRPGAEKLVGIRDLAQYKPDPDWLARPDVVAGVQMVGRHGLTYDLLTVPAQLPAAITAARACPDVVFVLDHLSKPRYAEGQMKPWATHVRALAELPNVAVKVSGMVTEADWSAWTVADFQPYVDTLIDAFGPARLMFGTDWPVCLLAATYGEVVAAAEELLAGLTAAEREAVFAGTARRVYGL